MPTVTKIGKRKKATLLLECSWDYKKDHYGPTPALIMAVIESATELKGLKISRWGWVDTKRRIK